MLDLDKIEELVLDLDNNPFYILSGLFVRVRYGYLYNHTQRYDYLNNHIHISHIYPMWCYINKPKHINRGSYNRSIYVLGFTLNLITSQINKLIKFNEKINHINILQNKHDNHA